jgi:PAS domain S-box-containing protein
MSKVMILLVEDDAIEAMDIQRILESEGYIVPKIASSGEEAQLILKDFKPDLILMDISLRGDIDGIKTTEIIKENYKIPVIYLTAHSEDKTVQRAKLTDPYAYLIKPFDSNELKQVIELALYKNEMEEKLNGKSEHFQNLFENAPVGIFHSTPAGKFCMANKALSDIFGYTSPEELITEVNKASISEKLYVDQDKRREFVEEVLEDDKWHSYKNRYFKKDGSIILAELTFRAVRDNPDNIKYLEGFVNDVTKQKEAEKALKDSESRYRLISENTGDVIWILDLATGKFNYVSPSVYNLRGYTSDEVLKQSQNDVMTSESFKNISENLPIRIQAFLSGDESKRVSTTLVDQIHKDGTIIPTEVVTTLLVNEEGQVTEVLGVSRDITERKKIEGSLIDSESLLRGLFNNMTSGVAIYNVKNNGASAGDYIIKEFNSAALKIEGMRKEEVIDKSILDLRPNIEEYGLIDIFKKVYDTGESYNYPAKMYVDENYSNWYENYIFKIPTGEIVAIYNDVTEQKASEEKLRESEEKYRSLFESDPDYTILLDSFGTVVDVNAAITNITGLSKEELIGKHFMDLDIIIEDDLNNQWHEIPLIIDGHNIKPFEARIIDKFGQVRWINVQVSTIEKKDNLMFILVIASDITDSKQFEKELKDSLKEKEVLLQEIHHRVKNNMQIISSLLNIQTRYVDDEESVNILKESQNRVRSMAMIHEKLYRSKNFNKIYFADYIESLVWDLFYSYNIKKGTIIPVLDIDDIKLNIETSVPCGLIITELVSNSLKYAFPDQPKGELEVSLKTKGDQYELTISDDGVGFPVNIDFKNTDSLGLQLVNSLTDQIDGKIELTSAPGKGTEFKIYFRELIYKERN